MLTPFSPFNIKCKKVNFHAKTSGNVFSGHLGVSFSYFPKVAFDHGGGFKQNKANKVETCQMYSKLTVKTLELCFCFYC